MIPNIVIFFRSVLRKFVFSLRSPILPVGFIILVFALAYATPAFSQVPYPCEPVSPCSTVAWTTGSYTTADVGLSAFDCSATINYKYRKCGSGFVELVITSITFTGSTCGDLSSAEIFNRALYLLFLSKIPLVIDEHFDEPENWKFWKVAKPGCIKKGAPLVDGSATLVPCSSDCCTTIITVEKNTTECLKFIYGWPYPNTFQPICPLESGPDGCHENCSINIEHSFDTNLFPH